MEMSNPMSEWKFKRDTAFRKQFFVPDSFAHPAKMDAQLLIRIVGETILDPMAGSGTTMLACTLGRNVILVELEEKFVKMCRDNWEQVKMRPQLGYSMGNCQIIQGDARQLEGLLVDKCVFSPPHGDSLTRWGGISKQEVDKRLPQPYQDNENNIGNLPYGAIDKIVTSPPYAETQVAQDPNFDYKRDGKKDWGISMSTRVENLNNLGNLPYGEIDKIITSPDENMLGGLIAGEGSFFISVQKNDRMKLGYQLHPCFSLDLVDSPANRLLIERVRKIFNCGKARTRKDKRPQCQPIIEFSVNKLDDLVGKVIPLCDRVIPQSAKRLSFERWQELVVMMYEGKHLTESGLAYIKQRIANINNLNIDSVIFSPPYEDKVGAQDKEFMRQHLEIIKRNPEGYGQQGHQGEYENGENIGNLKSDTYLQAMLQVYQSCYHILRPQGLMILVTKNFIRNKKIVRLDLDTIKLCEQAGFSFVHRRHRKLPSQSFWRIIYYQKHPDVPVIDKEDILVFRKEDELVASPERKRQ
jgi:DNA modification methylase